METDRDLEVRVQRCLRERHVPGLRRVQVSANSGTVTLIGQVASFYQKQLCHTFTRHVPGVVKLVDQLDVAG